MPNQQYTRPLSVTPNGIVDLARLEDEIRQSSITVALQGTALIPPNVLVEFKAGLSQDEEATLDSILGAHSGEPLVPPPQEVSIAGVGVSDHKIRVAAEKSAQPTTNVYTFDWTDQTTWYQDAEGILDEEPTPLDASRIQWQLAHGNVIDLCHGKVSNEDDVVAPGGGSYRVVVRVNGTVLSEVDPHTETGDYVINYYSGVINFALPVAEGATVSVDYWRARSSLFRIAPPAGKALYLAQVEVQFSTDIDVRDTLYFQLFVGGAPYGKPSIFKTLRDYYNDSQRAYPTYPALGAPGNWRSMPSEVIVFDWDYVGERPIDSRYGADLRLWLKHDTVFGGSYAAASFYFRVESV